MGDIRKTKAQNEGVLENPKSTFLFQNQKDKLFQLKLKNERKSDSKIDELLTTVEKAIEQKKLQLLFTAMDDEIISSYGGGVTGYEGVK